MIFNVNFKTLSSLIKSAFVGYELYRYQNARYNDKIINESLMQLSSGLTYEDTNQNILTHLTFLILQPLVFENT